MRYRDQHQRDHRDRNVDPENRSPRPLGQVAAEDRADRGETAGDAEEQCQCLAPLPQRVRVDDDRERGRIHDRATEALQRAERHQPCFGRAAFRREPAHRRCDREDDDTERDHFPVADGVAQAPAEREERRQRQQIGVDRPLHAGAGQTEFVLHFGRGDGHDGLVDERHRHGEDHCREYQRLVCPRVAGRRHLTPVVAA
jgi:hypothetical protein